MGGMKPEKSKGAAVCWQRPFWLVAFRLNINPWFYQGWEKKVSVNSNSI